MDSMALPRINVDVNGILSSNDTARDSLSSAFPELTFKERLVGFIICLAFGFLISVSAFGALTELMLGHPLRFAVLYSLGNLTSLCSTLFLVGIRQQIRNMSKSHRRLSAGLYLIALVMTLLTAYFEPRMKLLIIGLIIMQWTALLWYTLSYIPFGRRMTVSLASRLLG